MPAYNSADIKGRGRKKKSDSSVADKMYSYVNGKVQDSSGSRTTWTGKQVRYNKLRMRVKKTKTFPFVGCSNIRMPTAEIKIRKTKAAIYNVIFGVRPVVQAIAPPGGSYETALKIEKFLDHLIMEVMRLQNKSVIAIDQMLEQGFYLMMPYWKLEITTREETFDLSDLDPSGQEMLALTMGRNDEEIVLAALVNYFGADTNDHVYDDNIEAIKKIIPDILSGTDTVKVKLLDVVCDQPDIDLVSPERCYVPGETGFDPQDSECLVIETFMPYHMLETNAKYFGWDIKNVSDIGMYRGKTVGNDFQKDDNKDLQEGIDRLNSSSSMVRIWYYMGWYDLFNNGEKVKTCAWIAPDFSKTLKKQALPFYNGKFNIVKLFYELTDDRWYSHRGIVELAEDIIKEIDVQHNMKIDQQTIRNAPMFIYRAGQVNPDLIQLIPNQAIPVRGLQPLNDTVSILNNTNPNVDFSYEREQQILESKLEELTGQIDYTLQSQINKRQPRTLGEVQLQAQNVQQVFALDAGMQVEQFTELFNMIWDLWCQYGSDDYEFNYFGQNGWEKIKLSKEEVQGKYKIVVRGNDRNTNPSIRLQKASQVIQAATNPLLLQSGVITPIQMIAALKRFYQYLEVENWEEFINLQYQPPQPPPPPPPATFIKPDFGGLTDAEQMQVLASVGVQPDVQGRALKKREEMVEMSHNIFNGRNGNRSKGNGKR